MCCLRSSVLRKTRFPRGSNLYAAQGNDLFALTKTSDVIEASPAAQIYSYRPQRAVKAIHKPNFIDMLSDPIDPLHQSMHDVVCFDWEPQCFGYKLFITQQLAICLACKTQVVIDVLRLLE